MMITTMVLMALMYHISQGRFTTSSWWHFSTHIYVQNALLCSKRILKKFESDDCIGKDIFQRRDADINNLTPDEMRGMRIELTELKNSFENEINIPHSNENDSSCIAMKNEINMLMLETIEGER